MGAIVALAVVGSILAALFIYFKKALAQGAVRKTKFLQTKSEYESLLKQLENNSEDIKLKTQALEVGRKYYGYLHTDLVNFVDNVPVSNGTNSTIIETKIQSDLQARSKKG